MNEWMGEWLSSQGNLLCFLLFFLCDHPEDSMYFWLGSCHLSLLSFVFGVGCCAAIRSQKRGSLARVLLPGPEPRRGRYSEHLGKEAARQGEEAGSEMASPSLSHPLPASPGKRSQASPAGRFWHFFTPLPGPGGPGAVLPRGWEPDQQVPPSPTSAPPCADPGSQEQGGRGGPRDPSPASAWPGRRWPALREAREAGEDTANARRPFPVSSL